MRVRLLEDKMWQRWLALWSGVGVEQFRAMKSQAQLFLLARFTDLANLYGEPHRSYHNLTHIEACLTTLNVVRHLARNPLEVEFAIWYHDAIYDTHAHDNEFRSAMLARSVLASAGLPRDFVQRVVELIRVTKHDLVPDDEDVKLLVDIDLSILGQSPETFAAYEQAIRQEYAWVPDKQFFSARAAIMRAFSGRTYIYQTETFRTLFEAQARKNIAETWLIDLEKQVQAQQSGIQKGG